LAADGGDGGDIPLSVRALGAILSAIPSIRRRARFGLPDVLGIANNRNDRCLEVGPGQGITLAQLAQLGWQAEGIDIDPQAAATASAFSGCTVHVGELTSIDMQLEAFHLVYMNHVVEHLPAIKAALRRSYELLAAEGRLVLVYPNPDSLGTRVHQECSWNWDPPRHLALPSLRAIKQLLLQNGFRRVQVRTSTSRAAIGRAAARCNRRKARGLPGTIEITIADRLFQCCERMLVLASCDAGEEVIVTAYKN
jgi:SAM-dependent methyltransferase